MTIQRLALFRSVAVSTPAVWIASLVCSCWTSEKDPSSDAWRPEHLLLVGLAYPLVVAFPLFNVNATAITDRDGPQSFEAMLDAIKRKIVEETSFSEIPCPKILPEKRDPGGVFLSVDGSKTRR